MKKQIKTWREKDQREARWFTLDEAADMVQEPGLVALFRSLGSRLVNLPAKDGSS